MDGQPYYIIEQDLEYEGSEIVYASTSKELAYGYWNTMNISRLYEYYLIEQNGTHNKILEMIDGFRLNTFKDGYRLRKEGGENE